MKIERYLTNHSLECVNWPKEYPDKPEVRFSIAHDSKSLFLEFEVKEEFSRATQPMGGRVWEDSCVEMFVSPNPEDGIYYNLECNCAGSFILNAGKDRHSRTSAPSSAIQQIKVFSSVDAEGFEKQHIPSWRVAIVVPVQAFFLHDIETLDGAHFKGNFYKCGDLLPRAHFLSFAPINTPKPDFHRPEFFTDLEFSMR